MDSTAITQLLDGSGSGTGTSSLLDINGIMSALAPYILALTIVSILFMILYVISVVNKWRANKAIVDIKKLLIEINERGKLSSHAPVVMSPEQNAPTPTDTANILASQTPPK